MRGTRCDKHSFEAISVPTYNRSGTVNFISLVGMVLHVLLDLFTSQAFGIKTAARWHGRNPDKRAVLFDQIETRTVDPQIVPQFLIFRTLARRQRLVERQTLRVDLPPIYIFQIA